MHRKPYLHLLGAPELLNFSVAAGCDLLVLNVKVFLKMRDLLGSPVDSFETATQAGHFVATAPSTITAAAVTSITASFATVSIAITLNRTSGNIVD
jgi:hypothetical protein